jgi:hypothetical protein
MKHSVFGFPVWLILVVLVAAGPLDSSAAEDQEVQALVDELRALADRSRDQRAADRWLQQALEDLVAKYDRPWRKELLFDDFSDGDYTRDPGWKVVSGRFWVDASLGLRSSVRPDEPAERRSTDSTKDLGRALFGELLDQALKRDEPEETRPSQDQEAARQGPARIRAGAAITNAFSIELGFSVHNPPDVEGAFEVALLQEQAGDYGYALSIHTGEQSVVDLYRLRRGQRELISSSPLETRPRVGERHELLWRQAENGLVEVFMNGEEIITIRDKAFRDDYSRLELANRGGELGVRHVRVMGTPL